MATESMAQTLGAGEAMLGGTMLGFTQLLGDINTGPQTCMANMLLMQLAFQYRESPLLFLRSLSSLQPTTLVDIHPTNTSEKNFQSQFCPVDPAGRY